MTTVQYAAKTIMTKTYMPRARLLLMPRTFLPEVYQTVVVRRQGRACPVAAPAKFSFGPVRRPAVVRHSPALSMSMAPVTAATAMVTIAVGLPTAGDGVLGQPDMPLAVSRMPAICWMSASW